MMFDSRLAYRVTRPSRHAAQPLPASLVEDGVGDPLGLRSTGTECRRVTAFVRRADWLDETPPQPGDAFDALDYDRPGFDARFAVDAVAPLGREVWSLSCREVAP